MYSNYYSQSRALGCTKDPRGYSLITIMVEFKVKYSGGDNLEQCCGQKTSKIHNAIQEMMRMKSDILGISQNEVVLLGNIQ